MERHVHQILAGVIALSGWADESTNNTRAPQPEFYGGKEEAKPPAEPPTVRLHEGAATGFVKPNKPPGKLSGNEGRELARKLREDRALLNKKQWVAAMAALELAVATRPSSYRAPRELSCLQDREVRARSRSCPGLDRLRSRSSSQSSQPLQSRPSQGGAKATRGRDHCLSAAGGDSDRTTLS